MLVPSLLRLVARPTTGSVLYIWHAPGEPIEQINLSFSDYLNHIPTLQQNTQVLYCCLYSNVLDDCLTVLMSEAIETYCPIEGEALTCKDQHILE